MAGNTFGTLFRATTFGESHGKAVGVVVDGCPPGIEILPETIQKELDRRKPGQSVVTTSRQEADKVEILSGILDSKTTGMPICALVYNKNFSSASYKTIKDAFRPGHADYTFWQKYGIRDWRGGGRSSGRETIGRVIAGAIAKKVLSLEKISIFGHTIQIGAIKAQKFNQAIIEKNEVRCADSEAALKMKQLILETKAQKDSLGGIIEVQAKGVPAGLGEPVFDKLSADIGKAMFSIGAVKGVEIGDGFGVSAKKGSEYNDEFTAFGKKITAKTNHSGGILGGISTGNKIVVRLAIRPTASISKKQKTVDKNGKSVKIEIEGKHDPCICSRIIPVAESMLSLVLVDHWLRQKSIRA